MLSPTELLRQFTYIYSAKYNTVSLPDNSVHKTFHWSVYMIKGHISQRYCFFSSASIPVHISSVHKLVHATASNVSTDSVGSLTSVFLRPHPVPTLHSGLCSVCGRVTNQFAEDVIGLCAIVVATCCHRLPTRVSGYLVSRVIPALAK